MATINPLNAHSRSPARSAGGRSRTGNSSSMPPTASRTHLENSNSSIILPVSKVKARNDKPNLSHRTKARGLCGLLRRLRARLCITSRDDQGSTGTIERHLPDLNITEVRGVGDDRPSANGQSTGTEQVPHTSTIPTASKTVQPKHAQNRTQKHAGGEQQDRADKMRSNLRKAPPSASSSWITLNQYSWDPSKDDAASPRRTPYGPNVTSVSVKSPNRSPSPLTPDSPPRKRRPRRHALRRVNGQSPRTQIRQGLAQVGIADPTMNNTKLSDGAKEAKVRFLIPSCDLEKDYVEDHFSIPSADNGMGKDASSTHQDPAIDPEPDTSNQAGNSAESTAKVIERVEDSISPDNVLDMARDVFSNVIVEEGDYGAAFETALSVITGSSVWAHVTCDDGMKTRTNTITTVSSQLVEPNPGTYTTIISRASSPNAFQSHTNEGRQRLNHNDEETRPLVRDPNVNGRYTNGFH